MDKRKQEPIIGERPLFTLISATESSPTMDESCVTALRVLQLGYSHHDCVFD